MHAAPPALGILRALGSDEGLPNGRAGLLICIPVQVLGDLAGSGPATGSGPPPPLLRKGSTSDMPGNRPPCSIKSGHLTQYVGGPSSRAHHNPAIAASALEQLARCVLLNLGRRGAESSQGIDVVLVSEQPRAVLPLRVVRLLEPDLLVPLRFMHSILPSGVSVLRSRAASQTTPMHSSMTPARTPTMSVKWAMDCWREVSRMRTSCSVTLRLTASASLQENSFCAAGSGAPLPALPVWDKISALPLRLLDLATSKFPPGLE